MEGGDGDPPGDPQLEVGPEDEKDLSECGWEEPPKTEKKEKGKIQREYNVTDKRKESHRVRGVHFPKDDVVQQRDFYTHTDTHLFPAKREGYPKLRAPKKEGEDRVEPELTFAPKDKVYNDNKDKASRKRCD